MIILGLAELFILEKEIDILLLLGYMILWFGITYIGLQYRIFKRRKAIRSVRKREMIVCIKNTNEVRTFRYVVGNVVPFYIWR